MATANDLIFNMVQQGKMSPADADALFARAGVNVTAGEGRRAQYLQANPQIDQMLRNMIEGEGQGAMPIGREPIHGFERNALSRVGNSPELIATGYETPFASEQLRQAGRYNEDASQMAKSAVTPFNVSSISKFFNPFQKDVIDVTNTQISKEAQKLRDQVLQNQRKMGSGAFYGTYHQNRLGEIDAQELESRTENNANLSSGGWLASLQAAMNDHNQTNSNRLNSADILGRLGNSSTNIANTKQNVYSNAFDVGSRALQMQANAGQRIQSFNQGVADITLGDMKGQAQYPITRINTLLPLSQNFQSTTDTGQTNDLQQTPTTTSNIGGLLKVGAGLLPIGEKYYNDYNSIKSVAGREFADANKMFAGGFVR